MKTPFVSILIPMYNAKEYISNCLGSAIKQTVDNKNYEIIVFNDGSTDNSLEITKKMIKGIDNVKIFSKKNEGLSMTRTALMSKVSKKSEWVIWLDSDDSISKTFIEKFYEWYDQYHDSDYTVVKAKWIMSDKCRKHTMKVLRGKIDDRVMVRVMKKTLFDNYKFPTQKFAIEDWDHYIHKFKEIKVFDNPVDGFEYNYIWNENSLTRSRNIFKSRFEHAIQVFEDKELRNNILKYKLHDHYYQHLYMTAKLWFPDLLQRTKKIKFKSKTPLSIKMQYLMVKIGIFNKLIRKTMNPVNK